MRARDPLRLVLLVVVVLLGALQLRAIFSEAINWDEFAFLARTRSFLREGHLQGGGRPGLAELVLAPFARGCVDAVSALRAARVLWLAITALLLAGVYLMAKRLRGTSGFDLGSALAVALLGCVPIFLRWSLQVRSDNPAMACVIWSGVALLASRGRPTWALLAGLGTGLGALFSQKAAYATALIGLLALLDLWVTPEAAGGAGFRRPANRLGLFSLGVAAALGSYRFILPLFIELPQTVPVERSLHLFAYYRSTFGFETYEAMLPTLLPHLALLVLLLLATLRRSGDQRLRRSLAGAWAVLALGLLVGLFHAAAFPYFWLTLGLFPALAGALSFDPIAAAIPGDWARSALGAVITGSLIFPAIWASADLQEDTQEAQRDSLAFINRQFPEPARGFQVEGALACRQDPDPFPTYFLDQFPELFSGTDRDKNIAAIQREFEKRPVEFLVMSHVLNYFPAELQEFWDSHYVLYGPQVSVPGRVLSGPSGASTTFEVLKDARYRWLVSPGVAARLAVDGQLLMPGAETSLKAGAHSLQLVDPLEAGIFVMALSEPPAASFAPFYPHRSTLDFGPPHARK